MVKLITYNFNGSRKRLASILSAATRDHVDAIFGQEMHYYDVGRFDLVATARTLGWDAYHNPATKDDPKGGTAIFIRIDSQTITRTKDPPVEGCGSRYISVPVQIEGYPAKLQNFYFHSKDAPRQQMIEEISTNGYLNRGGIIAGDFNMLDDPLIDCERGEYTANAGFKAWRAAASKKGLTDAYRKFHGYEAKSGFTRRHGTNYTRIDRFYIRRHFSLFHIVRIEPDPNLFVGGAKSDHHPVVLEIETPSSTTPPKGEIKIDEALFNDPKIHREIQEIWKKAYTGKKDETEAAKFTEAIEQTTAHLHQETRRKRHTPDEAELIKRGIARMEEAFKDQSSPAITRRMAKLHERYAEALAKRKANAETERRKAELKQRPTKSFFRKLQPGHASRTISSLHRTPDWDKPDEKNGVTTDPDEICDELARYYQWLLGPKQTIKQKRDILLTKLEEGQRFSDADATDMGKPFNKHEVRDAINLMKEGKSPGPDRLSPTFYKMFQRILIPHLVDLFNEAAKTGHLPECLTQGDIICLYKKGDPREIRNYRPLTMLQVGYKVYARILVNRLKTRITKVISPAQLGFVPGRIINEASHLLKLIQAYTDEMDQEGIILALDWEKAFDRVSWEYMHEAMHALNMGEEAIAKMGLLSNTKFPPQDESKRMEKRVTPLTLDPESHKDAPSLP